MRKNQPKEMENPGNVMKNPLTPMANLTKGEGKQSTLTESLTTEMGKQCSKIKNSNDVMKSPSSVTEKESTELNIVSSRKEHPPNLKRKSSTETGNPSVVIENASKSMRTSQRKEAKRNARGRRLHQLPEFLMEEKPEPEPPFNFSFPNMVCTTLRKNEERYDFRPYHVKYPPHINILDKRKKKWFER